MTPRSYNRIKPILRRELKMRTIPYKEDLITEFKSDLKRYPDNDLIDEIVGMANTKGGNLYLGVEDDGEITG